MASADKFYGLREGLSNGHVNNIYQDRNGLVWVCTDNGLNSFDGVEFKTFSHVEGDTASLGNNSVLSIYDDSRGNLWVGTAGGLPQAQQFFSHLAQASFGANRVPVNLPDSTE